MAPHQDIVDGLLARARGIYDPDATLPDVFAAPPAESGEALWQLLRIDRSTDPRDAGADVRTVLGRHHDGALVARLAGHMTALRASIERVWHDEWRSHADIRHEIYPMLLEPLRRWDPSPQASLGSVTYHAQLTASIPVLDLDGFAPTPAVRAHHDVGYLPRPNAVIALLDGRVPPAHLTSTSFLIAIDDRGRPLLARNANRGLEASGGHIEPGEDAEAAARREGREETGATVGDLIPLGSQLLVSQGHPPKDWRYPFPVAHQAFFAARILSIDPYEPNEECVEPLLVEDDADIPRNILPFVIAARQALGIVKD